MEDSRGEKEIVSQCNNVAYLINHVKWFHNMK